MRGWFRKSAQRADYSERKIKLTETGFLVVSCEKDDLGEIFCRWAAVLEVFAYKIDLFSYDEICIGFRHGADDSWWVGESYTGYKELVAELPRRFPGIRTDWAKEVAAPAFAPGFITLWGEELAGAPHDEATLVEILGMR